jgi:hypothetical protein
MWMDAPVILETIVRAAISQWKTWTLHPLLKRRSYGSYHPLSLSPFIQAGQQAAPCAGHQGETSYVSSCCLPPTQTASSRRHGVRSTRYRKPELGFVNSFGVTQGSLSEP